MSTHTTGGRGTRPHFTDDDTMEPIDRKVPVFIWVMVLVIVVLGGCLAIYIKSNHNLSADSAHQAAVNQASQLNNTFWSAIGPATTDQGRTKVTLHLALSQATNWTDFVLPPDHPSVVDGNVGKIQDGDWVRVEFSNDESFCGKSSEHDLVYHLRFYYQEPAKK